VNLCAIATRAAFHRAGSSIAGLAEAAGQANPALAMRLSGLERCEPDTIVAAMSFSRRRPVAGDLLLAGDAAAIIAPLCGDGIGMALTSAAIAEPFLAAHLAGAMSRQEMLARYAVEWRRRFSQRLALGSGLQRLLCAPAGAVWALRLGRVLPPLVGWLVRSTHDSSPLDAPVA
jgi:2-polyprenyl-6-methoxyphenol hydroxylase-like FAD-dependent oxidoreductase